LAFLINFIVLTNNYLFIRRKERNKSLIYLLKRKSGNTIVLPLFLVKVISSGSK